MSETFEAFRGVKKKKKTNEKDWRPEKILVREWGGEVDTAAKKKWRQPCAPNLGSTQTTRGLPGKNTKFREGGRLEDPATGKLDLLPGVV